MHYLYYFSALITNEAGIPKAPSENLISNILNQVYFWSGAIAVIMIIVAGYFYITSVGDAAKVKRAKDIILGAVIGLVVVLLAFSITRIVMSGVAGS